MQIGMANIKNLRMWDKEQFSVMNKMTIEEIKDIQGTMDIKAYKKGTFLYFPEQTNHHVFFLKSGQVKIGNYLEDGQEDIKSIIGPGSVFGEIALLGEYHANDFAMALKDCVVCFIDVNTMHQIMARNQNLRIGIHKVIGRKIAKLENRLESIIFKNSKTRILEYLEELKNEYGRPDNGRTVIPNFLTHLEIAKITATSRQTVTTVLNSLRDSGIIEYDKKQIIFNIGSLTRKGLKL